MISVRHKRKATWLGNEKLNSFSSFYLKSLQPRQQVTDFNVARLEGNNSNIKLIETCGTKVFVSFVI